MIAIVKRGSIKKPKKKCYKTKCDRCKTKFVFNEDDIKVLHGEGIINCPVCNNKIPEYEDYYVFDTVDIWNNFKRISQWRYNRIMKNHNKGGDIDH